MICRDCPELDKSDRKVVGQSFYYYCPKKDVYVRKDWDCEEVEGAE